MSETPVVHVAPIGADLVALAKCHALDASTFPFPSLPYVLGGVTSLWVARAGADVLGFAAVGRDGSVLDVESLAVAKPHRGTGVGRALLRAVLADARARGFVRVQLHVSTANAPAVRLYRSEGFREERLIERFYSAARFGDGGNAWLMTHALR